MNSKKIQTIEIGQVDADQAISDFLNKKMNLAKDTKWTSYVQFISPGKPILIGERVEESIDEVSEETEVTERVLH